MLNLGKVNINLLTQEINFVPNTEVINELKRIKKEVFNLMSLNDKIRRLELGLMSDGHNKVKNRLAPSGILDHYTITNLKTNVDRLDKILKVLELNKFDDETSLPINARGSETTIPSLSYQIQENNYDLYLNIYHAEIHTNFFIFRNKLVQTRLLKKQANLDFLKWFRIHLEVKDKFPYSEGSLKYVINKKIRSLFNSSDLKINTIYQTFCNNYKNVFKAYGITIKEDVPILINQYYNIYGLELGQNEVCVKVITEKSYNNLLQYKNPYEIVDLKHFLLKTLATDINNIDLIYETINRLNFKQQDIIITNDNNIIYEAINFSQDGCNRLAYTGNSGNKHFTPELLGTYYNLLGYKVYYIRGVVRCLLRDCYIYEQNMIIEKTVAIRNYYLNSEVKGRVSAAIRLDQASKGFHLLGIDESKNIPLFMYYHLPVEQIFKTYLENLHLFLEEESISAKSNPYKNSLNNKESLFLNIFYEYLRKIREEKNNPYNNGFRSDSRIISLLLPELSYNSPYIDAINTYSWDYECMISNKSDFVSKLDLVKQSDSYIREKIQKDDFLERIFNVFLNYCESQKDINISNILKELLNYAETFPLGNLSLSKQLRQLVNNYKNRNVKKEEVVVVEESSIQEKPTLEKIIYKKVEEVSEPENIQEIETVDAIEILDAIVEELTPEEAEEYLNDGVINDYNDEVRGVLEQELIDQIVQRTLRVQELQVTRRLEAQENNNILQNIEENGIN